MNCPYNITDDGELVYVVYGLFAPEHDSKPFRVGVTIKLLRIRLNQYRSYAKGNKNSELGKIMHHIGLSNVIIKELYRTIDKDKVYKKENELIEKYGVANTYKSNYRGRFLDADARSKIAIGRQKVKGAKHPRSRPIDVIVEDANKKINKYTFSNALECEKGLTNILGFRIPRKTISEYANGYTTRKDKRYKKRTNNTINRNGYSITVTYNERLKE